MRKEDFAKLKEPFPSQDIEWRLQSCGKTNSKLWGKCLAYVTSRAVQERLDSVCGPDGWQVKIEKVDDAYLATISIRVEHDDGTTEWISKTDGADVTDIEPVKGGISGAIKRAAVLFGVGRYLYNLENNWAIISDSGKYSGQTKDKEWFKWNPPALPDWALPASERGKEQKQLELEVVEEKSSEPEPEIIANPEVRKAVAKLQMYIDAGKLTGKTKERAETLIKEQDLSGINKAIKYVEDQEGVSAAFGE